MGVKGLRKFVCSSEYDPRIFEVIPSGSILLVDGISFVVQILDRCCFGRSSNHLFTSFSYDEFHAKLVDEVNYLQNHLCLKLWVYFDHKREQYCIPNNIHCFMKSHTDLHRYLDRENSWQQLKTNFGATGNGSCKWTTLNLPWPSIIVLQAKYTLEGLNVPIYMRNNSHAICELYGGLSTVLCDLSVEGIDVDVIMASHCACLNSDPLSPAKAFIYSRDSDFMVMKNCPFIEMGTIRREDGITTAKVWRRDSLARSLQFSEQQFVEFCLLLGNDFTNNLDKYELISEKFRSEFPVKVFQSNSSQTAQKLRKWFKGINPISAANNGKKQKIQLHSRPCTVGVSPPILASHNPRLQLVIDYCVDFYNHDLDRLNKHKLPCDYLFAPVSRCCAIDFALHEEEAVLSWYESNGQGYAWEVKIGYIALDYLLFVKEERNDVDDQSKWCYLNVNCLRIIRATLDRIADDGVPNCPDGGVSNRTILWDDIVTAHLYQQVLRVLATVPKYSSVGSCAPRLNFDWRGYYQSDELVAV